MPKTKIRLYFPDLETGQVSVGFSTVDVVNHVAEIDGVEIEAIRYWEQTASAYIMREARPDITINHDANPFALDADGNELPIGV